MTIQKMPLTKKQKEVYEVFKEFVEKNNYSPTMRELKEILNSNKLWREKSIGAVQACLRGMALKGWVRDTNKSKKARTLKLN